mgnify:CR=1 FL=1
MRYTFDSINALARDVWASLNSRLGPKRGEQL